MNVRPMLFVCAIVLSASAFAQSPAETAQLKRQAAEATEAAAKAAAAEAAAAAAAAKAATDANAAAAAAKAATAPPAVVYKEGVIKVGTEMKQTLGKVADIDKGDNGCYITLMNEKNVEFIEVGKFEICSQKPPIKGKKVALAFSLETIQAASCYGDPKCKKTETVPLVVGVKIVE